MAVGRPRAPVGGTVRSAAEYEEITVADALGVLHRRRILLVSIVVLSLVLGGAYTLNTPTEFEASAVVIPLAHAPILREWMESRLAAETVGNDLGARLHTPLFGDRWDATAETWRGPPPTSEELGHAVKGLSRVRTSRDTLTVTVTSQDAVLSRDVAAAYVASLTSLRPYLENLTQSELFDKYYDGTNALEAQGRAETAAKARSYWIVFDSPSVPTAPVRPQPVLYMSVATAGGVAAGLVVVALAEWLARYRAEFARVPPPPGA